MNANINPQRVVSLEPRPRRTDNGIDILPATTFAQCLWRDEFAG